MTDFESNQNYIQELIVPNKYYEKSIECLFFANRSQMHIKYELNNVHVCQNNIYFKISTVLVKNMIDKVI